jgi:hypothetical protein
MRTHRRCYSSNAYPLIVIVLTGGSGRATGCPAKQPRFAQRTTRRILSGAWSDPTSVSMTNS